MRFATTTESPPLGALVLATLLACSSLVGCATSHLATGEGATVLPIPTTFTSEARTADRLRGIGQDWEGVPYRYGGTTRSGIDCSAFARAVYYEAFRVTLPRNTAAQVQVGQAIGRDDLQVGDLVFFKTGRRSRHVGVYLGNDEFLHASTSQGVIVSSLDESYYKRKYWTARRVLPGYVTQDLPLADATTTPLAPEPIETPPSAQPTRPVPQPTPAEPARTDPARSGQTRTGW